MSAGNEFEDFLKARRAGLPPMTTGPVGASPVCAARRSQRGQG
jgi:hypothetical protein